MVEEGGHGDSGGTDDPADYAGNGERFLVSGKSAVQLREEGGEGGAAGEVEEVERADGHAYGDSC